MVVRISSGLGIGLSFAIPSPVALSACQIGRFAHLRRIVHDRGSQHPEDR
jgi:hypothetical protein